MHINIKESKEISKYAEKVWFKGRMKKTHNNKAQFT